MLKIKSALISVYYKDGLEELIAYLAHEDVQIYSTGGTQKFIEEQGVEVYKVEDLTSYPSILDGRVKTLHPKVFGGILAKREESHQSQLNQYDIPEIDLVIVDLYPFEETVRQTEDESEIIEKIDIGGISLIRAAAKNYNDVVVISSKDQYPRLLKILEAQKVATNLDQRRKFAREAFALSSHYDREIEKYFSQEIEPLSISRFFERSYPLRYGENPHQKGIYYGELNAMFHKHSGKELSFNNLVDVDAAVSIMKEFKDDRPTFAVLKHTNPCGIATRQTLLQAWKDALAGDPTSAFGGVLICNTKLDLETAKEIDSIFYEVLIATDYEKGALAWLSKKKKRILLEINHFNVQGKQFKTILNGVVEQEIDNITDEETNLEFITKRKPSSQEIGDLLFASKCAKHLKSNTIVLVKNQQLLGMGCGQTSRVDACKQAIAKAQNFGFDLNGSVMASDAFFPFPDCVELGNKVGVTAVIQPGGSINDNLSIDYCNSNNMAMVFTNTRHFKH